MSNAVETCLSADGRRYFFCGITHNSFMKKKLKKVIDFLNGDMKELNPESETDPLGSYTGAPLFPGEPEQDADDL